MDRWQYARGEHPPYCTCVKCVEARKSGKFNRSGKAGFSGGNPIERFTSWLKRLFRAN